MAPSKMMFLSLAAIVALSFAEDVASTEEVIEEPTATEHHVVDLTIDNFEHLTQASTGMTTGDWFIKFYAPWCGHCQRMAADWEELSVTQYQKVNIAQVDCTKDQPSCARFDIGGYPTLIYLKNGKQQSYAGKRAFVELNDFVTTRGLEDAEWTDIAESSPMKEKMEKSMLDVQQSMKQNYPKVIAFIEDLISSDTLTSDPMLNAVFVGLAIGACILLVVMLLLCVCDSCCGGKASRQKPITSVKKIDTKGSDDDSAGEDKSASPTKLRKRVKATTD